MLHLYNDRPTYLILQNDENYWFAETTSTDPNAPVILWLNGGPGSSSVLGMLQENGPLIINATGGLMENPHGWTQKANLVILESPSGVGYSYCANSLKSPAEGCINTDNSTARAARVAMQDFFGTKFPELAKRDFFITGGLQKPLQPIQMHLSFFGSMVDPDPLLFLVCSKKTVL